MSTLQSPTTVVPASSNPASSQQPVESVETSFSETIGVVGGEGLSRRVEASIKGEGAHDETPADGAASSTPQTIPSTAREGLDSKVGEQSSSIGNHLCILYPFGSYRIGVHENDADIDLLCIAPQYATR
jgi:hypothetical protein